MNNISRHRSEAPFPEALDQAVGDHPRHPEGDLNLRALAQQLAQRIISEQTLYRMVGGTRELRPDLLEAVAAGLNISPEYFVEYRLWQARRLLDPREVGFEEALSSLHRWEKTQKKESK